MVETVKLAFGETHAEKVTQLSLSNGTVTDSIYEVGEDFGKRVCRDEN
jgi:hypothetical protein